MRDGWLQKWEIHFYYTKKYICSKRRVAKIDAEGLNFQLPYLFNNHKMKLDLKSNPARKICNSFNSPPWPKIIFGKSAGKKSRKSLVFYQTGGVSEGSLKPNCFFATNKQMQHLCPSVPLFHDILLSFVPFCVTFLSKILIMDESLLKLIYFSSISVLF